MDALREGDDKSSNSSLSRCQSFQVHEAENLAFCHFWGTRVNKDADCLRIQATFALAFALVEALVAPICNVGSEREAEDLMSDSASSIPRLKADLLEDPVSFTEESRQWIDSVNRVRWRMFTKVDEMLDYNVPGGE
ncbi:hypothetical protein HPP92_023138 [Vanilla planifolia]|uniref:Uncharacterized protein n=1 Tax=Vanilla planifolia TaxID=51239 RepID=A0A835PT90_VANPL|nr:hypothetical protein HPP92_023138 [Vanilla planifolia]